MYNNHELQDQDLQLAAANEAIELDDNELDNITGGVIQGAAAGAISWFTGRPVRVQAGGNLIGAALSTPEA